ncbi:protein ALWAYS EARLY 3 isoform X5 [Rosa chinensis]|uniref:protein ALWAYS EARLY 3 isoform X5 n=1 Tax=Rosa chinensis TaxID=74649 RepID=UPI001AD8A645|nr:protein ALWAYS EARLY 3 isoform X5 [Rosa chinensis]
MAPIRKTKGVNKRFPYINKVASNKYGDNANKNKQKKRKMSDMLGPQWTTEELKHFYEGYRKYGKDWMKVASVVRHRSLENVEALYTMNRAYLSLPEGTASVIGLTAMMCDYYSMLERSDSEQESIDDAGTSRKPRKLARGKLRNDTSKGLEGHIPDISHSRSIASDGCLSLLKNRRTGIRPHAVKKRTPRVPVSSYDKDNSKKYFSPARQGIKTSTDGSDVNMGQELAFSLTEPSHKGSSPQVSRTPKSRAKGSTPSPVQNGERMFAETDMKIGRPRGGEMDGVGCELSLGSMQADYDMERYYLKRQKREESENKHLDDVKESSSGTEEEQYKISAVKGKLGTRVVGAKNASSFHKDRKKTKTANVGRDEDSSFDALLTLADLSLRMPEATAEMESSAPVEEENFNIAKKSKLKGNPSVTMVEEDTALKTSHLGKLKEGLPQSTTGIQKRKQKSPVKLQINENEAQTEFPWKDNQMIESTDEVNYVNKVKRSSHYDTHQKQGKLVKPLGNSSSTTDRERQENNSGLSTVQVQYANQANLTLRDKSRRKDIQKDAKSLQSTSYDQPDKLVLSVPKNELNLKGRLSNCLSRYQARRWCAFEWFYSAIDFPWFAKREFVEYLNHVGLGHVPRLTRVEWGVIRSSLGRPRRFSDQFLKEEKEKLHQYRESVRKHYAELNAGTRDGLPTDLARPLSVGQHVIAFHPRSREIHNGIVLSVDHSRYRVQFDQSDLGVADIMDIDCMPLNPLENVPASFTRQNIIVNKYTENFREIKINEQQKEGKTEGYMKAVSTGNLNSTAVPCHILPTTPQTNKSSKHIEGKSSIFNKEAKVGPAETASTKVANSQPSISVQMQAKEADVRALFELTRALDKKDAVVSELRRMNDEVFEKCRDGDDSIKNSEPFKKEYAAVLLQLSEINDQVSSALFCLRQRNTYRGSYPLISANPLSGFSDSSGHSSSLCHVQEPATHVYEIVESSRAKAKEMVHVAMQAISSLKRENNIERIQEVIDFVSQQLSEDDAGRLSMGSSTPAAPILVSEDQSTACTEKPDPKSNSLSNQSEDQLLSDLIANCVAALFMIQTCTARQFSPADVAWVLDRAVTSLKPICTQNLPVYGEIQKCMGIVRSQILALVPT